MPAPLLETKFYLPPSRPQRVLRPRLMQRMDAGTAARLLLVCAPAGFGKTTLVVDWLGERAGAVAWLSLDRGDSESVSFWTYVIAALGRAVPGLGTNELSLLGTPHPPPICELLTSLLNDLGTFVGDVVLVLDDYHFVEAPEVQESVAFLLDHAPPHLHLVMLSRADPAIPLARLRARGELVEVRAAELRFTADEVTAYLTGVMDLPLTVGHVAALADRTEGWIAALQLAALSMQGRADAGAFIAGFTGDDRYIVDYLVEEVLQRQSEVVRSFLLQTSVLSRLSGPVCESVTGTTGGRAMLEDLDRRNLFLVPLDDRRAWYRYHHLFADVLRARLSEESPGLIPSLHARACGWCSENGEPAEAIEHAISGHDFPRAAGLMELAMPALARDRQEARLRNWVERLPAGILDVRPVLSNGYAGALMSTGEFAGVDRHLSSAERWLAAPTTEGAPAQARQPAAPTEHRRPAMVVADDEGFRRLPAAVAIHRAGLALATGDPAATIAHATIALGLLEEEHHLGHAAAAALIGLASWSGGDLASAGTAYQTSLGHMRRAEHLADVMGLSIALADIQVTKGSLREAKRTYEYALSLNPEGGPALRGTADMYVGLSTLHLERNELPAAEQLLVRSQELGEHNGLPQNPYRWRVAMAAVREAHGNHDQAVSLLDDAVRMYAGDFSPNVRPVSAARARVAIRHGRTAEAMVWAREEGVSADDEVDYLREYSHLTLARALLARRRGDAALEDVTGLLGRLLDSASKGRRTGNVIEILMLQALAHGRQADEPSAVLPLAQALELAEPEGYVRVFLDEGTPMVQLLRTAAAKGVCRSYVGRLLAASETPEAIKPSTQNLVDPLSQRELDVLRLLGSDLGGPQIADELVVSLNTIRTHTKNIYAKLGVNNRRAAVRRAGELGLLRHRRGH